MYVLQLNPSAPRAWNFRVTWGGYWAGLGYVANIKKAVRFQTADEAYATMLGIFVGLNGCMQIVELPKKKRH